MTAPKLAVIRGEKRVTRALKKFDWSEWFRSRDPAPNRDARLNQRDVIPLLEGWVRLLQRKAGSSDV